MRKHIIFLALLLLPSLMKGEGLKSLLRSVETYNKELMAAREQLKAAGYELKEQNTLDNTSVEYSPFFRKGASGVASSELIVQQEFDFPSLYVARGKAGKSRLQVLENEYLLSCRSILLQATENYLALVRLNKRENLLSSRLKDAETLYALYEKKADTGEATAIDVNRLRLRVMDIKRELLDNEAQKVAVTSALDALNGYEAAACDASDYPDWTESFSELSPIETDAEVKAAASEVESCRKESSVARQGWVPKLTLGYRRNTELDEASNGLIVGASFPIFSTSAKVKAAKARETAAQMEMDNALLRVAAEREAAKKELDVIRRSLDSYDLSAVEDTERLFKKSLDLGAITLTDYYTEIDALNDQRLSYIDLEYEYYMKMCVLYKNALKQD